MIMSLKKSIQKKRTLIALLISIFASQFTYAQIQPVTVNATLKVPSPIFLYDYTSMASQALSVVTVFNDLNEPGWDVSLRISIESSFIKIQTNPVFFPAEPIHLLPGVATTLKGEDLAPYLNYNNLIYEGISQSEFIRTGGRLPTGFYTFCVEVYDYVSKKKISNSSCASAYIQLNGAPIITLPLKGGVVKASENQNITFQWQPATIFSSGNLLETEYSISVYEIFKENTDPDNAIANKQVLKIYESDYSNKTNFNYNLDHPLLEIGKRYAIQVHAQDIQGRNSFENEGFSEASWFYYGYPEGGNIELKYPENKKNFSLRDFRTFKWGAPDNLLDNQPLFYKLKIVKTEGSEAEDAIVNKPSWYEKTTDESTFSEDWSEEVPAFDPQEEYAWQVTAHTGEQNTAKSSVNTFTGPPLLEKFWVGNHLVYVTTTENKDLNNLSGTGKVRISNEGELFDTRFDNISLYNRSGEWVLSKGEIKSVLENSPPIELKPDYARNDKAFFYPDSIKIGWSKIYSNYTMFIHGHFEWDLPLAVDSIHKGIVKSKSDWIYYDTYKLIGSLYLAKGNNFKLLEPLNHLLVLSEESKITMGSNNSYRMELYGDVYLPKPIKNSKEGRMKIPFYKASNLFYIKTSEVDLEQKIWLVKNSKIYMTPVTYYLDFSDEESPAKHAENKSWKGVYFEKYKMHFEPYIDETYQLKLDKKVTHEVNIESNSTYTAWTNHSGLELYYNGDFDSDPAFFNTFPSKLLNVLLKIDDSYVSESHFKGSIKIPVISETTDYSYTIPVADNGFQTGYLDKDLANTSFSFNPDGGQQKINLTIRKAVFLYNEKLQMSVDIDWPELGVKLQAVNGFCAWGNYSIGFYQPNSTVNLTNQVAGKLNGFDVTLQTVGCGSSEAAYGIGSNMIVVMAENVSGPNGAPDMNIYSVCANPFAPQIAEGNFNIMDESDVQETIDSLT